MNIGDLAGFFIGMAIGLLIGMSVIANQNENDLLRFCMTHSIPLEQCKIPEKGE